MTGYNSTFPKVAVQWLNQALCFNQSFCLVDSEVLRNRHLRVAAKRWATNKKSQPHKQAHLVFADIPISIGTNAEKPKEPIFLPTHCQRRTETEYRK